MHHDPEVAVIVLAPGPGLVDLADVAVFILRVHPAHGGGGVTIKADHSVLRPGIGPGAAFARVRIGLVPDGEAEIIKLGVTTNEVRDGSAASGAEGGVAIGPGGFKGDRADLVVVGAINDISGEGFGGILLLLAKRGRERRVGLRLAEDPWRR